MSYNYKKPYGTLAITKKLLQTSDTLLCASLPPVRGR